MLKKLLLIFSLFINSLAHADIGNDSVVAPDTLRSCISALAYIADQHALALPVVLNKMHHEMGKYNLGAVLYDRSVMNQLVIEAQSFIAQHNELLAKKVDVQSILDFLQEYQVSIQNNQEVADPVFVETLKGCGFDKDCFSANCGRFNKLRVGSQTVCGSLNVCGPINGIRIPSGLRAYGYFYTTCSYVINFDQNFTFDTTALAVRVVLQGIDGCPAVLDAAATRVGSQIILQDAGVYLINYSALTVLVPPQFAQLALYKNDILIPGSVYVSAVGIGGQALFRAQAGDIITLRNKSIDFSTCLPSPVTVANASQVICSGAFLSNVTASIFVAKIAE